MNSETLQPMKVKLCRRSTSVPRCDHDQIKKVNKSSCITHFNRKQRLVLSIPPPAGQEFQITCLKSNVAGTKALKRYILRLKFPLRKLGIASLLV